MSTSPSAIAAAAGRRRLVAPHLKIVQRDLLTRRNGRISFFRSSATVEYDHRYLSRLPGADNTNTSNINNNNNNNNSSITVDHASHPRLIDAEIVHGDDQKFWRERRSFYRKDASFMPSWDRQAHALILLTARRVARAPQQAAFRLFAMYLRLLLLPRIAAETAALSLPLWVSMNAEALLTEALESAGKGKEKEKEGSGDGNGSKDAATAAAAGSEEKKDAKDGNGGSSDAAATSPSPDSTEGKK